MSQTTTEATVKPVEGLITAIPAAPTTTGATGLDGLYAGQSTQGHAASLVAATVQSGLSTIRPSSCWTAFGLDEDALPASEPLAYDAAFQGPASADKRYPDKAGCALLTVFWLFLLLLLVLSTYKTSPQWLQHPSNSAQNLCGASFGAARGQGFLWWPSAGNLSDSYCVASCPQAGYVCVNVSTHVGSALADCPRLFSDYATTAYMGYCLPNDTTSSAWTALYLLVSNPAVLERVMLGDAWRNWFLILACSGLAVIMGKLLLSTLVNDPALYLAATFIGAVAFLAFLGSTILFLGGVAATAPSALDKLPAVIGLKVLVLVLGIAFLGSAFTLGLYLLLQLGSGRLMLGIRLIRTACMAFNDINYTSVLPMITSGILFCLGMYAFVVGTYMYAMQEQNRVTGKGLVFTRWIWFTSPVHAFGGIWSACFVLAVLRMTTTTLVSTWYWTVDPKAEKMEALAVPAALQECLTTHSASLALAALLFVVTAPLKVLINVLPTSRCLPAGVKASSRHFSSSAYPQMALHGYSLRQGLSKARHLLARHQHRMRACEGAAHAAVMPGKVTVTAACTCAAVWLTRCNLVEQTFTMATVGVVTLAAYTLSCAFLTMHEQAVEAMLQCFCEDCERNDGSAMHPYYMPDTFKKIILEAADRQNKKGSRMLGAIIQIAKAGRHALRKALEPFVLVCVRVVGRWKDQQRQKEYRLVKQQSLIETQGSIT